MDYPGVVGVGGCLAGHGFECLAGHGSAAAMVHQNYSSNSSHPIAEKVLEPFVAQKCPGVRFKALLLPEHGGSIGRAGRNFQEPVRSGDALASVLESGRDFLCGPAEEHLTPGREKGDRLNVVVRVMPGFGLRWLRQIPKAVACLVSGRYSDYLQLGAVAAAGCASSPSPRESSLQSVLSGGAPPPPPRKATTCRQRGVRGRGAGSIKRGGRIGTGRGQIGRRWFVQGFGGVAALFKDHRLAGESGRAFRGAQRLDRSATWSCFACFCKICWWGGGGLVSHRLPNCRKSQRMCTIPCNQCKNGPVHWGEGCFPKTGQVNW